MLRAAMADPAIPRFLPMAGSAEQMHVLMRVNGGANLFGVTPDDVIFIGRLNSELTQSGGPAAQRVLVLARGRASDGSAVSPIGVYASTRASRAAVMLRPPTTGRQKAAALTRPDAPASVSP